MKLMLAGHDLTPWERRNNTVHRRVLLRSWRKYHIHWRVKMQESRERRARPVFRPYWRIRKIPGRWIVIRFGHQFENAGRCVKEEQALRWAQRRRMAA